ncbi:MAG: MBOAT family protein [Chloroflexi bacterium]|nr:MBOAT family protein [Chloroflexota bacterium]
MSIVSLAFAGYVLLVLAAYYALPRRPQNWLLLAASYGFYALWDGWLLGVLLALTAFNYLLAQRLAPAPTPPEIKGRQRGNRRLLWAGIGVNLAALGCFKYADFFAPEMNDLLDSLGITSSSVEIVLPVGMSFYVVAVIAYLVDVFRGQMPPSRDPVDFALFMAYFPKLVAGPVERARTFLPQLAAQRTVDNAALERSLALIAFGVTRKLVIADPLNSMIPAALFDDPGRYGALELWGYLLAYAFALYNDFAGYTSVVRGVSGLFGIELSRNFRLPYLARSFSEFWNRWHITLSHWLRDYVFYPTSRALLRRNPRRDNVPNLVLPPMLTMLASGLWHGPGWQMLAWGGLHGVYLVGEQMLALRRPVVPPGQQPLWRQAAATGVVFVLVLLAWVPFRCELPQAVNYWRGLADFSSLQRPTFRLAIVLIPALALDWMQRREELAVLGWPRLVQATLLALETLAIFLVLQADTGAPFVYGGF